MTEQELPQIRTVGEMAEYFKVSEEAVLLELEQGVLHGFRIGGQWRSSDTDIRAYVTDANSRSELGLARSAAGSTVGLDWETVEIEAFDFSWPKRGGGGYAEHYDEAYEATKVLGGRHYTFRIGFGHREVAGLMRRRVTLWLGSRAVVEFAGGNDFDHDGLLAGIIRLKDGRQLKTNRIPEEYNRFKVQRYDTIVRGPRASTGMAVVAHKDDLKTMLEHAFIRASWKKLI